MTPVNLLDTVIMKFPFSSRNDYIVLYHAGFGGEFITGLLSQNVPGANRLDITPAPTGANRWAIVCKVGYSDIYFSNGKDFKIEDYLGEDDKKQFNFYKDHYVPNVFNYWPKNMTAILLDLSDNYEYWAKLTYAKLKDVNISSSKRKFLKDYKKVLRTFENDDYKKHFKKSHVIDINQLHEKSIGNQLQKVFPDLNTRAFDTAMEYWIQKNNELLDGNS